LVSAFKESSEALVEVEQPAETTFKLPSLLKMSADVAF
jgi:hypothetical protein